MTSGPQSFQGWWLASWSLQHELLELNFEFRPSLEEHATVEAGDSGCYRGRGIFSRPTRIAFSKFEPVARVERVDIALDGHAVVHRFGFAGGAYVEVRAKAYVSIEW